MNRSKSGLMRRAGCTNAGAGAPQPHQQGARIPRVVVATLGVAALMTAAVALADDLSLPPITVGAGAIGSYNHNNPDGGPTKDDFSLDDVRLYINGSITPTVKFTFDSDYDNTTSQVSVIDAIVRFEFSDQLNIWAGRFLAPSDRANLYGPYYSNLQQGNYTDGIQDGYSSTAAGRTDGVAYWGQFGPVKVSAGLFNDPDPVAGQNSVIVAERVMVDFWDPEPGYYLNGTYYGDKDILAVGVVGQERGGNSDYSADFLLEKRLPGNSGVFTLEAEYARYDHLAGLGGNSGSNDGGYGLVSYLFPRPLGPGKVQILGKYASTDVTLNSADSYTQKTKDVEFNYIIKEFNLRTGLYFHDETFDMGMPGAKVYGVSFQVQM